MTINEWILTRLPPNIRADKWTQDLFRVGCKNLDELAEQLISVYHREDFGMLDETMCNHWEKLLGISGDGLTLENRRAQIKSAYLAGEPPTVELIQRVANSYANGSVDVSFDGANQQILLTFNSGIGIPDNEAQLKKGIARVAPAHLLVVYGYLYLTCEQVEGMTIMDLNKTPLSRFAGRGYQGDVD